MAAPVAGAFAAIWAGLVAAITQGVFNGHVQLFVAKTAIRLGIFAIKVGAILLLISVLANGIADAVNALRVTLPPMLGDGIDRILPGNFVTCISAIIAAKGVVFFFSVGSWLTSQFMADV